MHRAVALVLALCFPQAVFAADRPDSACLALAQNEGAPVRVAFGGALPAVVKRLGARVVLPMHWFSAEGLRAFPVAMGPDYAIEMSEGPDLVLSSRTLPKAPRVIVLSPALIP